MDKRVLKTKKSIKSAFLEKLSYTDLNKIKVSEIAEMAEINRKTFYLHYVDIYDLASEIKKSVIEKVYLFKDNLTIMDLQNLNEEFVELLFNKLEVVSAEYFTIIHTDFYKNVLDEAIEHFRNLLIQAYALGKNKDTLKTFDYAFTFLSGGIVELFIEWYTSDSPEDRYMVKEMVKYFLECAVNSEY